MSQKNEIKSKVFISESGPLDGSGTDSLLKGNDRTFEGGLGNHVAYADAAGSTPVDMTGGSPTSTLTINDATPLNGTQSARLSKDAANRQGEGESVTVDVSEKFRGKPTLVRISYRVSANWVAGDPADPIGTPGDTGIYLYDVTNSKLLTPNTTIMDGSGLVNTGIQIPSDCEQIRLGVHIQSVSALAYDIDIDDVDIIFAPNSFSDGVVNDSATVTGFTSRSSNYVLFATTLKAPTKGLIEIDTAASRTKFVAKTKCNVSITFGAQYTTTAATVPNIQLFDSTDTLKFLAYGTLVNANSAANGAALTTEMEPGDYVAVASGVNLTNSNTCHFSITAQTVDQSYQHQAASGLNAQVIGRFGGDPASTTANQPIIWPTAYEDSVGSYDNTTGEYTVKTPGVYDINGFVSGPTLTNINAYVNGLAATQVGRTTSSFQGTFVGTLSLNYGDVLTIRPNVTVNFSGASTNSFNIFKIGSQSQPYAPRVAYLRDEKTTGTQGGTFTSGAWRTRTLNIIDGDTSFVSLSANQFTLQPGTYHIEAKSPVGSRLNVGPGNHKAKLRNITDSSDDIMGSTGSMQTQAGFNHITMDDSDIEGIVTIVVPTVFEIQHQCQTTHSTYGFGIASNYSTVEIYTQVKMTKVL